MGVCHKEGKEVVFSHINLGLRKCDLMFPISTPPEIPSL